MAKNPLKDLHIQGSSSIQTLKLGFFFKVLKLIWVILKQKKKKKKKKTGDITDVAVPRVAWPGNKSSGTDPTRECS